LLLCSVACRTKGSSPSPFPSPPATSITPFPVDIDAIVRTCVIGSSCVANPLYSNPSNCVAVLEFGIASGKGDIVSAAELRRLVDCATNASTCAAAVACANRNHGDDYCSAHPNGSCDGNISVNCPTTPISTRDCGALGLMCQKVDALNVACTDGTSPLNCNQSMWRCDGNRFVGCGESYDCSTYAPGYSCRPNGNVANTLCQPSGPACTSTVCNNDVLDICAGGEVVRVDCTVFASHCGSDGPQNSLDCVPNATDCKWSDAQRCNGSALEFCVNGKWRSFDCTSIGLTSCAPTPNGAACR
jgi:hypothetical protein